MRFILTVECDNAAFEGAGRPLEVSRLLNEVSRNVWSGVTRMTLLDRNGNVVGTARFEEETTDAPQAVADEATRLYHEAETSVIYERSGTIRKDLRTLRNTVDALRARAGLGPSPYGDIESEQEEGGGSLPPGGRG